MKKIQFQAAKDHNLFSLYKIFDELLGENAHKFRSKFEILPNHPEGDFFLAYPEKHERVACALVDFYESLYVEDEE